MPLEIKELHIKINVDNSSSDGGGGSSASGGSASSEPEEATIAACVEKVLEILKEKTER